MKFDPLFLFQANSPEDIPPVIATGFSYLISIFRNDLFFVSVVENEGLYQGFDNYLLQRDKFLVRIFRGIWQYKLSLSYLKEHSKLYINFLYNNSVSCLGFEINYFDQKQRAFCHLCIRYAYVTGRVKAKFLSCKPHVIINMKLDFPKSFSTKLTHNILRNL
jgi:hypothetical protein